MAELSEALEIVRVGYGHPDATLLIDEVQAEYVVRYGGPDHTPLDPMMFEPPLGSFYVGYLDLDRRRTPVATGAWRFHDDVEAFGTTRVAEIKRMYVVPAARARGLARAMLAHLERTAAEAGPRRWSSRPGPPSRRLWRLYESSGFTPIPSFGYYKDEPLNRCYAKPLPVRPRSAT